MNKLEVEKYIVTLTTQVAILKAQIAALQKIFYAYLASEHNEKYPNFSENVKAENADIFGEKLFEYFELLPAHDPIAEKIRDGISLQLKILKNDIDEIENSFLS